MSLRFFLSQNLGCTHTNKIANIFIILMNDRLKPSETLVYNTYYFSIPGIFFCWVDVKNAFLETFFFYNVFVGRGNVLPAMFLYTPHHTVKNRRTSQDFKGIVNKYFEM